jgi:hypothetical protein
MNNRFGEITQQEESLFSDKELKKLIVAGIISAIVGALVSEFFKKFLVKK